MKVYVIISNVQITTLNNVFSSRVIVIIIFSALHRGVRKKLKREEVTNRVFMEPFTFSITYLSRKKHQGAAMEKRNIVIELT